MTGVPDPQPGKCEGAVVLGCAVASITRLYACGPDGFFDSVIRISDACRAGARVGVASGNGGSSRTAQGAFATHAVAGRAGDVRGGGHRDFVCVSGPGASASF